MHCNKGQSIFKKRKLATKNNWKKWVIIYNKNQSFMWANADDGNKGLYSVFCTKNTSLDKNKSHRMAVCFRKIWMRICNRAFTGGGLKHMQFLKKLTRMLKTFLNYCWSISVVTLIFVFKSSPIALIYSLQKTAFYVYKNLL